MKKITKLIPTSLAILGVCGIVGPADLTHAKNLSNLQVETKEKYFTVGQLTLPSNTKPDKVVQDALQKKIKHVLAPNQVNGEVGVDFQVIQQRPSYDNETLVRVQQMFQGKEVYGHQLTAHVDDTGVITSISGKSAQQLKEASSLKKEIPFSTELATKYIYDRYGTELQLIKDHEIKQIIYINKNGGEPLYSYKVTVNMTTPSKHVFGTYLVDASNGKLLQDMMQESDIKTTKQLAKKQEYKTTSLRGNGIDSLGILRTFGVSKTSNGTYSLEDYTRGGGIKTFYTKIDDSTEEPETTSAEESEEKPVESSSSTFHNPKAVSAHYIATKSYDFYKEKYNRNSIDNKGGEVHSFVMDYSPPMEEMMNAENIENKIFYFGSAVNGHDIGGHEYTHGVTNYESNLEYYGESGAINEAISDILGTAIEKYMNNGDFNWDLGEKSGTVTRNMKDPSSILGPSGVPYPDDYSKYDGSDEGDKGGVHFNSSIINKVAYLIAEGGTHNDITVEGIGENKMFDLFYYVNVDELNQTSNFVELRHACIKVATIKYGKHSKEVNTIAKAFDAAKII
ncbi:M4 family metallopeptidase [Bacillus sp. CDB3]|uniref:M4 family metallopeptidase n=1 Tax=Bacillus sp. CDB3 TaxID=360310 RepID=UPI0009D7F847|nr:M4 family metallopeptidase [Bacillus sp. CDB3]OQR54833.1 peptidase M4 family protein [Bacillus sp. CDB3]